MSHRMDYLWIVLGAVLLAVLLQACAKVAETVHNSLPEQGEALARAEVRREHAAQQVEAAKPAAKAEDRVRLDTASDDLSKQRSDLAEARNLAKKIQGERDQLERDKAALATELAEVKATWGYRVGQWVRWLWRAFWWAMAGMTILLCVLRFVAGTVTSTLWKVVLNALIWISRAAVTGGLSLIDDLLDVVTDHLPKAIHAAVAWIIAKWRSWTSTTQGVPS